MQTKTLSFWGFFRLLTEGMAFMPLQFQKEICNTSSTSPKRTYIYICIHHIHISSSKKNDLNLSPKDVAHLIPLQSHPRPLTQHKWELPTHLPQSKTMLPRSSWNPNFERPHNTKQFGHFRNPENLEMTTRKAAVGNFRNYLWNRCFFRKNGV